MTRFKNRFSHLPVCLGLCCVIFAGNENLELCAHTITVQDQASDAQDEQQRQLRIYLQQHGLRQTEIKFLEQQLSQTTDAEGRESIALDLIKLYTAQLQDLLQSRQSAVEIGKRIDGLLSEFPELGTDQIRISMAYATFQVLKKDFETWIWERDNAEFAGSLVTGLTTLRTSSQEIDKSITEKLLAESFDELSALRDDLENRQAQIRYLIAWSSYYLAMLDRSGTSRSADLAIATREFEQLLQLPQGQTMANVEASSLELRSEWVCRLLVGAALCHAANGNSNLSSRVFEILTDPQVPASVFEHLSVWQLHSEFFPGNLDRCLALADFWRKQPERISGRPPVIWSTVYMSGATWPDKDADQPKQLVLYGLSGLAAENQFDVVTSLTSTYPVAIEGDDFFANWIRGYLTVSQSQDQESLQGGIDSLQRALTQADPRNVDSVLLARCRIHLAFALYQAQDYESCAENIQRIAAVLRYTDPAAASQAMWLRCQALGKLAATNSLWHQPFLFALSELQTEFPETEYAQQAEFMEMMDRLQNEEHDRALKTLTAVSPDSPNYDHAQYEICRLWHRRWSDALANQPDVAEEYASKAYQVFGDFYSERSQDQRPEIINHLIHVCLLACDISLRIGGEDLAQTLAWVARCEQWNEQLENNPLQHAELRFVKLSLAVQRSDQANIIENANWLVKNSNSLEHQRTALIQLCLNTDREIASAAENVTQDQLSRAITLYDRLIKLLKQQQPSLNENSNLQVALARLANYLVTSGQSKRALEVYNELLGTFPGEVLYIDAAARLYMGANEFESAAELWRRMIAGSRQGTDQWLNAKLQLVRCLSHTDKEMAKSVLLQTRILAPDLSDRWRQAFDQLAAELGVDDSDNQ